MRKFLAARVAGSALERPARRLLGRPPRQTGWLAERNRDYDRMTAEIIRRVMRPDSNSADAGANEGLILRELLRAAPRGAHHAFEPIPELAQRLRERLPAAIVHQVALADYEGESVFRYLPQRPAESSLYERSDREAGQQVVELTVPVHRLDALLPADMELSMLKVDVEDAEVALLRGAMQTLRRWRPVVVIECHIRHLSDIADLFAEAGLELFLLRDFLDGVRRPRTETERLAAEQGEWYFVGAPDVPQVTR